MENVSRSSGQRVTGLRYRAPWSRYLINSFSAAACAIVASVLLVMSVMGPVLFPASILGQWWISALDVVLALMLYAAAFLLADRKTTRELILHDDHLLIGGLFSKSRIVYDHVVFITLQPREEAESNRDVRLLRMRLQDGRERTICLDTPAAEECFEMLRRSCKRAAAVGAEDELHEPSDSGLLVSSKQAAAAEFRRRAVISAFFVPVFLIVAAIFIFTIFDSQPQPAWYPIGAGLMSVFFCVIAVVSARAAIRRFRMMRACVALRRDVAPHSDFAMIASEDASARETRLL